MNTPTTAIGMLLPIIGLTRPPGPYLPMRGPSIIAPTSAAQPPTECTSVDPAKSWKPAACSQPPPHFQEPPMVYTMPTNTVQKIMKLQSLMRSATAPETIVAQVAANMAWNRKSVQYV